MRFIWQAATKLKKMFTIKIDARINTIKMSLEVAEDGKVEIKEG